MSFFTKIKELFKEPTNKQESGQWYYHTKILVKIIVQLYKRIELAKQQSLIVKTGLTLSITDVSMNMHITEIINKWGKARCSFSFDKKKNNRIDILFYRRPYVYENTLIQLQFLNNRLFFMAIDTGKSMMTEADKLETLSKFLPDLVHTSITRIKDIPVFTDVDANYLLLYDDINLLICYVNGTVNEQPVTFFETII